MNGKGSNWRPTDKAAFDDQYARIFGHTGPKPGTTRRKRWKASPVGAACERVKRSLDSGRFHDGNLYEE